MTLESLKIQTSNREWISEKELSELTGFARSWFQQKRFKGEGIPYTKFGDGQFAPIRYRLCDVEKWIAERTVKTGSGD